MRLQHKLPAGTAAIVLALAMFGAQPGSVAAAANSAKQAAEKKLNDAQSQLHDLEAQLADEQNHFEQLQVQLASMQSEVQQGEKNYSQFTAQIDQTRTQMADAHAQYTELRAQLDGFVRDAYIEGPNSTIIAIFDSQSQLDLGQRLDFLGQISQHVTTLSAEVSATEDALTAQNQQSRQLLSKQAQALKSLAASKDQVRSAIDEAAAYEQQLSQTKIQILDLIVKYRTQIRNADISNLLDSLSGQHNIKYGDWAKAFLATLGDPSCQDNLVVLVAWQAAEGTSARYNPLATTYDMPGATTFNYAGVKNYASLKDGLEASKQTLEKGASAYGYGDILKGLQKCDKAENTAAAIAASSWCGCGDGYVAGLIGTVQKNYNYWSKI